MGSLLLSLITSHFPLEYAILLCVVLYVIESIVIIWFIDPDDDSFSVDSSTSELNSNSNSNSNRSIESSLLSMQLHILKNQPDQIQSSYREVESLLIEAYREILSIPQERRLQIQSQQFYTMNLLAKLGDRSRASTLIMTHLRKIPKGRSDSVVDHINLLRVRQSLYWKLEEKEASNLSTIMSDFEWTTIQIAQQFLEEGDYASTLETLISASHRNRISTHFVQEMGSIVAKLSSSNLFQSDVRADIQNHLTYNFDCFGSSERSALLSSLAISKLKTANKSNMSKFYEEVYSLLHSAVSADSENKQAWHELSSLLFSLLVQRNQTKMDLPFVTPEYLVATIISALRLDCTNTSLLFWLFYSINNHQKTLSEKILKLLESIPLHLRHDKPGSYNCRNGSFHSYPLHGIHHFPNFNSHVDHIRNHRPISIKYRYCHRYRLYKKGPGK